MREPYVQDVVEIVNDQQHINAAYYKFKEAMNELLQAKKLSNDVLRVMHDMYRIEDVLWQHATEG